MPETSKRPENLPTRWLKMDLESTLADCRTAAKLHEQPHRSELLSIVGNLEELLNRTGATADS